MKQKLLNIKSIKTDTELYPRNQINYITTIRYASAMTTGAIFPPITVTKNGRKYTLIDGAHRIAAAKMNKETHIQAEVLENLSKKEIFIESIKRNNAHGLQFSAQEQAKTILKLKDLKVTKKEISEIVRIPVERIDPFMAKRMIRIVGSRGGEKGVEILKKELKHLAGTESMDINQEDFMGASQARIVEDLINLIQSGLIDWNNKVVARKMKKLTKLLNAQFTE